jgi:signal recognition particle GTPase
MVFVGINGVGKSTSLSKVCYFLKTHGLKVRSYALCIAVRRDHVPGSINV